MILLRGRGPLLIDGAATAVLALGDPLPPQADAGSSAAGETGGAAPETAAGSITGLGEKGYRALVDDFERALIRAALERLTNEDRTGMGHLIKAIALSGPRLELLPGFET